MKDMIYRQAAIDAFDCSIGGVPVESVKYVSEYADKMMSRINALPSAQSDVTDTNVGDIISREDAIDAVAEGLKGVFVEYRDVAEKMLNKVPSAQPDLSDYSDKLWRNAYERGKEEARIQKMQDLEQAEIQKAYELGKLDAMEEMPHWIPCSERLPKPYEYCLWTTIDCRVVYHHCDGLFSKYIAWMPLPEPYNGGNEDDKKYNG